MPSFKTTFWLPDSIIEGLRKRELERVGSIIRKTDSKQIVNWLRDHDVNEKIGKSKGVHPFLSILFSTSMLDNLKDEDLIKFVSFVNSVPELASLDFYGGRGSMERITKKHDDLLANSSKKVAGEYIAEKRKSILHTFNKSYLPQVRFRLTADMLWFDIDMLASALDVKEYNVKAPTESISQAHGHSRDMDREIEVEFEISSVLLKKLKSKKIERIGGVLREADSKKIVAWLEATRVGIPGLDESSAIAGDFNAIIEGKSDVVSLENDQLFKFVRWLYKIPALVASKYSQPLKSALRIVIIHDRVEKRDGKDVALEYKKEKRMSLLNLLGKSFLPNVQAAIVRGEIDINNR